MINKTKFYLLILSDYQFLAAVVLDILNKYDDPELQLALIKAKIKAAHDRLQGSANLVKSNSITEELAKLDTDRDDAWMAFYHHIISCARRLNPESREYANKLLKVASVPEMQIHQLGYQKQTINTNNFFKNIDSNAEYIEALEKIAGNVLYGELKAAQSAFEAKEAERFSSDAAKGKSESTLAAKEVRNALEELEKLLFVMNQLSGKPEYAQIAAEINEVIDEVNAKALARVTRRENNKEEEEPTLEG